MRQVGRSENRGECPNRGLSSLTHTDARIKHTLLVLKWQSQCNAALTSLEGPFAHPELPTQRPGEAGGTTTSSLLG